MAPKVIVVSGHMVDAPDRSLPRFPQGEVTRVTAEIRTTLDEWGVNAQTTVVTGGARGADIIVAEDCLARHAKVVLCLALPPDQFERRSVALPQTDWSRRFRRLLLAADVRVLADGRGGSNETIFARTNAWILDIAESLCHSRVHAIVVWDGQRGDGPGGTAGFIRLLGEHESVLEIRVIDPAPGSAGHRSGATP